MGVAAHFLHLAILQRDMGAVDAYNVRQSVWQDLPPVRCRLVEKVQRILNNERTDIVAVTTLTLLVGPQVEVDERMRVRQVTLEDGTDVVGPFTIQAVLVRRTHAAHHKSLVLGRVV
jgi:hypothetical protein